MQRRRLILLAHNIRSLWNVGSFFRTADAFAIEKIYLTGYTGHPPRKEITKTALGAEEFAPWEHASDPLPILRKLKANGPARRSSSRNGADVIESEGGWQLIALELIPDATDLQSFKPSDKVCLIVGHELTGVPEEILSLCDATVRIPMLGKKESLNVAVAAGIALHHLRFKNMR